MAYLVDTSILVRIANKADSQCDIATHAVVALHRRGEVLHITPQVLIEFRNVATRPVAQNGLGLSSADAAKQAANFETTFPVVGDTADIYPAWKLLVENFGIIGKQVHDARLMAVCQTHGLSHLLTFNAAHFARTSTSHPTVIIVDPRYV